MKMTAGVKCYNNARYIRDALESAFSQTYRPLEIIISDDGSDDGSREVIDEVLRSHEDMKDVDVVLNRNESNLGNLGNWEKICELASGEFIVKFDGDDVSLPERVERIAAAILESRSSGLNPTVAGHGGFMTDPNGRRMGLRCSASECSPVGAVMAFSRRCFTEFGKSVCDPKTVDDEIYARRGLMLGDFLAMPDRLVLYRTGTGISNSLFAVRVPMSRGVHNMLVSLDQCERDAESLDSDARDTWLRRISEERKEYEIRRCLIEGSSFRIRKDAARRLGNKGRVWSFLKFAFVCPRVLGDAMLFLYAVTRYAVRRINGLRCFAGLNGASGR